MHVFLLRKGDRDSAPVFQGDEAHVAKHLAIWGAADLYEVYDGTSKYEDAREFLVRMGGAVRPADGSMTPEEKIRHENLMDPRIHMRNYTVQQWVARAIRLASEPNYDPELLVKNTSHEIIRLFY